MKGDILQHKHELWLTMLFGAFSVREEALFDLLYDFAKIEFRHLGWIGGRLREEGKAFDFEKGQIDFLRPDTKTLLQRLMDALSTMQSYYQNSDDPLYARCISDENYMIQRLQTEMDSCQNESITAANKERLLTGFALDRVQTDALTQFLFEESYKEYELILVYLYANIFTDSKLLSNIFIDLIDESQYHLKQFARMMRSMGLLSVPRTVMEHVYKFDDLERFLIDGIKEEEGAKEECLKLAREVGDVRLTDFFEFINYQENYHIALMEKALTYIKDGE